MFSILGSTVADLKAKWVKDKYMDNNDWNKKMQWCRFVVICFRTILKHNNPDAQNIIKWKQKKLSCSFFLPTIIWKGLKTWVRNQNKMKDRYP